MVVDNNEYVRAYLQGRNPESLGLTEREKIINQLLMKERVVMG